MIMNVDDDAYEELPLKVEVCWSESDINSDLVDEIIIPDPLNDFDQNNSMVSRELSKEDEDDEKDIVKMFGNDENAKESCCSGNCNSKIPKELAIQHRYAFQELDKKEKELVIMSHLQQHRRVSALMKEYAKLTDRKPAPRKSETSQARQLIHYYFCDLQICKKMYFFIHDLGSKEFKNIIKHYDEHGLTPRVHKLKFTEPKRENNVTVEQIEHVVAYIKTYSEQYGRQMPHRTAKVTIPKFKNYTVIGLPENMSKTALYNMYCQHGAGKQVGVKTFMKLWNTYCPYIISLHRQATSTSKLNGNENHQ